jgi:para-nitrobenzyl esterase
MRNNVVKMAKLKHDLQAAPAYAYYFKWQLPTLDGSPALGLMPNWNSASRTPSAYSWATFAAHGKPSIPGVAWQARDAGTGYLAARTSNDPGAYRGRL